MIDRRPRPSWNRIDRARQRAESGRTRTSRQARARAMSPVVSRFFVRISMTVATIEPYPHSDITRAALPNAGAHAGVAGREDSPRIQTALTMINEP